MIKCNSMRSVTLALVFLFVCELTQAADIDCDVPDVGVLKEGTFKLKKSITHYWQGAAGGVNTKNADRISGLYDLDLCYLLSADESANNMGDYMMAVVSAQSSFGNGVGDSKVGGFFNINDGVKGDNSVIIDKLFLEFTAMDRLFTFNIGKIDLIDYFDHNAVANEYKTLLMVDKIFNKNNM